MYRSCYKGFTVRVVSHICVIWYIVFLIYLLLWPCIRCIKSNNFYAPRVFMFGTFTMSSLWKSNVRFLEFYSNAMVAFLLSESWDVDYMRKSPGLYNKNPIAVSVVYVYRVLQETIVDTLLLTMASFWRTANFNIVVVWLGKEEKPIYKPATYSYIYNKDILCNLFPNLDSNRLSYCSKSVHHSSDYCRKLDLHVQSLHNS